MNANERLFWVTMALVVLIMVVTLQRNSPVLLPPTIDESVPTVETKLPAEAETDKPYVTLNEESRAKIAEAVAKIKPEEEPKIKKLLLATCNEGPMWPGARICVTDAQGETHCGNLPYKYTQKDYYNNPSLTTTIRAPKHVRDGYTIRIYSVSRGNYTFAESKVIRVDDDGEMDIFFIINNPECGRNTPNLPVAVVGQEWLWPKDYEKWCEKKEVER